MTADSSAMFRAVWRALSRAGRIAAALCLVAALVFVLSFWPFLTAVFGPRPTPPQVAAAQQHAEQQKKAYERYLAQIGGRSLFVIPVPPTAPEPEPVVSNEPDKPPPPPSVYGGPTIVAMLSDMVWFSGGKKLKLGEKSDDLEVLELNPPWDAKLKWKDVEFTVSLFDRNKLAKAPDGKPAEAISPEAKAAPDPPPPPPKPKEAPPTDTPTGTPPPPPDGTSPGSPSAPPPPPGETPRTPPPAAVNAPR